MENARTARIFVVYQGGLAAMVEQFTPESRKPERAKRRNAFGLSHFRVFAILLVYRMPVD
jgi:hypothetical protein